MKTKGVKDLIMTYREMRATLAVLYGESEARAMADYVLGEAFGLSKADIICGAVERLGTADKMRLSDITRRLADFEPVQYVLGGAEFCGRRFKTAPGALIPRPETEELCRWIASESDACSAPRILDIGTGTGCIACTLALDVPGATVSGWDISVQALAIAHYNAVKLGARVALEHHDILNTAAAEATWDIVVSNPPYICNKEKKDMSRNVLEYEPHCALFVPDDDPLLFYRAIARYSAAALKPEGRLYFEINPLYAADMETMLASSGFSDIVIKTDEYGKQRMVSCTARGKKKEI